MKLRKMLYGFTLLLGVLALSSCVNDEEETCLPEGKTEVLFSLVLQDNAQTRATWGEDYPKRVGVDYDNYIDLDNVQMLLFNASGNYVGTLGDMTYSKTGENTYQYIGTAPKDINQQNLPAGDYKFVVLANCADAGLTVGSSTIADLNDKVFNYLTGTGDTQYIPMWGVLKATLTLVAGNRQELGAIHLLRAVAKVTVKLSPEMIANGFSLQSLKVDKYNTKGYVTPTNASTVSKTKDLDQELCIRPLASAATNLAGTVNNDSVVLYLPEYKNIGSTTPATMSVTLKLTEEIEVVDEQGTHTTTVVEEIPFPAGIAFKDYNDTDSVFDIVRNHHYIFTIISAEVGHKLTLRVVTIPWEDAQKIEIDYTQTIGWKDSGEPQWSVTPVTEGEFEVINVEPGDTPTLTFTLDSPQGWQWLAVLEPLTDNANSFIQFQDGSSSATGSVGQLATLNFKITTDPASVNHRARLRLYVQTPGSPSREVQVKYIISRSY